MIWFAIATLSPAIMLAGGAILGGIGPFLGLCTMTVLVFVIDRAGKSRIADMDGKTGLVISILQALAHTLLWTVTIWAVAASDHLSLLNAVVLVAGAGLYFGQISNSNAHELIHKANRRLRRLGIALYCSVLFGHHTSAHMRVHHVHAATLEDPNSARLGEGFWRYLLRAWPGGFWAGKRAEDALRARNKDAQTASIHPYAGYLAGAASSCAFAWLIGGRVGLFVLLCLAVYAQLQLYLSDYVQHYGLSRQIDETGRVEPMGLHHSWNAPHWYSSAMMLHAPRHSDHHANPARAFPDLRLNQDTMPMLPHSLPVMAVLALVPPIWFRLMDGRAMAWLRASSPL